MKYRLALLEQLKSLPYFDKRAVRELCEPFGLKSSTVDAYISQSIRRKEILQLRKGLYVSAVFFNAHKDDVSYVFYLANVIRKPSYVSSWTALQYYNLTTEVIRTNICVTSRITRNYRKRVGTFEYKSIRPSLFNGFSLHRGTFEFFIASPSKALFDLIYFRTNQLRSLKVGDLEPLVEALRIDIEEMSPTDRSNLRTLIDQYKHHE